MHTHTCMYFYNDLVKKYLCNLVKLILFESTLLNIFFTKDTLLTFQQLLLKYFLAAIKINLYLHISRCFLLELKSVLAVFSKWQKNKRPSERWTDGLTVGHCIILPELGKVKGTTRFHYRVISLNYFQKSPIEPQMIIRRALLVVLLL